VKNKAGACRPLATTDGDSAGGIAVIERLRPEERAIFVRWLAAAALKRALTELELEEAHERPAEIRAR